jgi:capsular polysaccharide export protein
MPKRVSALHGSADRRRCICFGFSFWKRDFVRAFLKNECVGDSILFLSSLKEALEAGVSSADRVYVWGFRESRELAAYFEESSIAPVRVEDGFLRSVSLGSDLSRAYSLDFDSEGIYYDPRSESSLERILKERAFDDDMLRRARRLRENIVKSAISKYNASRETLPKLPPKARGKRVLFVPGQVEDDASVVLGAGGMGNGELLRRVRDSSPDSFIIYKAHPDVEAGNRRGELSSDILKRYADMVLSDISAPSVLDICDEVHTMTSLVGFEALLRGKRVVTYGIPFYAGWGLTEDRIECSRRGVKLSLDELTAAALLIYPRYIDPVDMELCEAEEVLEALKKEKSRYNENRVYRFMKVCRNTVVRAAQRGVRIFGGEQNRKDRE